MPELEYQPAPPKPEGFDDELKRIGGVVAGSRPRYRAVWGMDETEWFGDRERVKYISIKPTERGLPRWVIERWIPPGMFNPAEWRDYKSVLGDYPSNGLYIFMFVHTDDEGSYAPLDGRVLARIQFDNFYLRNPQLEAREFAKQAEARERMRIRQEQLLEDETKAGWVEYFAREDYYNAEREYSFASRLMNPSAAIQTQKGETRTAAGIILPPGVKQ